MTVCPYINFVPMANIFSCVVAIFITTALPVIAQLRLHSII